MLLPNYLSCFVMIAEVGFFRFIEEIQGFGPCNCSRLILVRGIIISYLPFSLLLCS